MAWKFTPLEIYVGDRSLALVSTKSIITEA